jgi:hypothetical protein
VGFTRFGLLHEGFWAKSEGKGAAFGGFPLFFFYNYLGKYGRYQFPLTSTSNYEVSSS